MAEMRTIKLNETAGAEINATIARAIDTARRRQARVAFDFNGVAVEVEAGSNAGLIYRDWDRAMSGYVEGVVGPHPARKLTSEDLASDARIAAENEAQRQKAEAECRERAAREKAERAADLATAPAMTRDEPKWQRYVAAQNGSAYGLATLDFAEAWARLMQKRMAEGAKLPDIADECIGLADRGVGITGFMLGCAASALAEAWAYGEEFRRWHNAKYGVTGDRPGTVNPAVLTISSPATREDGR